MCGHTDARLCSPVARGFQLPLHPEEPWVPGASAVLSSSETPSRGSEPSHGCPWRIGVTVPPDAPRPPCWKNGMSPLSPEHGQLGEGPVRKAPPESGRTCTRPHGPSVVGLGSNRPPQTPAPGEERSRQHRPVGQWYVLYLFLTPTPWPTLAGLRAHPLLVFPQNKAASTRHAKVEASIRAGERELHLCLLLLKEGVWGVDLPLNGETGRLGWGWGVRAPG